MDSSFRTLLPSLLFSYFLVRFLPSFLLSFGFETHIMTFVHEHDPMNETHSYGREWFHCRHGNDIEI